MKRTRPRQHIRRCKSGKRVLVNKGVKKKNYGSRMFREQYLPKKKIFFKDDMPNREKKIIGEIIRKNPELLSLKGERKYTFTTGPMSDMKAKAAVTMPGKQGRGGTGDIFVARESFNKAHDPVYYEQALPDFKAGVISEDYFDEYKEASKFNIPRSLAHEFKHTEQINKAGSSKRFIGKYKKDPGKFEEEATSFAQDFFDKKR